MKLIEPTVKIIEQGPGIAGLLAHIDYCAGICYNRTTVHEDPRKFVDEMIKVGHMRPLEFGTVYLTIPHRIEDVRIRALADVLMRNKYSIHCTVVGENGVPPTTYLTTNYRVIVELGATELLDRFMTETTEHHRKRVTVGWHISRGIADEFRTHITLSSLMKSTRYVNETKHGMEFVKPFWFRDEKGEKEANFVKYCENVESEYNRCIKEFGMKPQEAREYLPLSLGVELYQCGFVGVEGEGWNRFFQMRCDTAAHPDARMIAEKLMRNL